MSNGGRIPRRADAAVRPEDAHDPGTSAKATGISGTRPTTRTAPTPRTPLPTPVEESLRLGGERATVVPPSSMEEYARRMMHVVDDTSEAAPPTGRESIDVVFDDDRNTAPATGRESIDVVFEDEPSVAPPKGRESVRGRPSSARASQHDVPAQIAGYYLERLGSRDAVPYVAIGRRKVTGVPLDHWAGFVLSLVDGLTSVQDIVDLSPMPEHEVLNVLDRLHEHGLIRIRRRRARA